MIHKKIALRRVRGVEQCGFARALYQVRVVTGAVRQRDQRVEQAAIPVNRSHPVDAILGAAKQMHTVIADECTGCDLCIPPCPVECIHIVPVRTTANDWTWPLPESAADGIKQSA